MHYPTWRHSLLALCCGIIPALLYMGPARSAVLTAKQPSVTSFSNRSFETPDISAAQIVEKPASAIWTFNPNQGGVGYAVNGSAFGNPTAPDGNQVLYIQSNTSRWAAQTFTAAAGRYRLSFKAAQRPVVNTSPQSIAVSIDSAALGTATPAGPVFGSFAYDFNLAAGSHTLKLEGLTAGDNTAFLDDFLLEQIGYIAQGSFEAPAIPASPGIVQGPTPSDWSFTAPSGYAANGSGFQNPPAVSGTQVLYLMSTSSVQQSVTLPSGRLRLTVHAAQRPGNNQVVRVNIDGVEVGRIAPTGTGFQQFVFDALVPGAGSHVLSFVGQTFGDHTVFLDDISLMPVAARAMAWSDPNTWDLGRVPTLQDDVQIPADAIVRLDATALQAQSVAVAGELHCGDQDIGLTTALMTVEGRFICGSPYSPYTNGFTLTLWAPPLPLPGQPHEKQLMVMAPGVLELHGEPRKGWTQLAANAAADSNQIQLVDAPGWRVGDWIVIAPTDYASGDTLALPEMTDQSEKVQITAIDSTGKTITLDNPATQNRRLQFLHYGQLRSYSKTNPPTTWTLDERAEVGLLKRNILIQGDAASATTRIGGHMMSMAGSQVHVSGIELFQMGQENIRARYPFHWHRVGNAPGQYIRNSSIHASYNRCITVHGTHDTLVEDNVCYDFIGHGYFLEDGIEQNNTFQRNLGILARRPTGPENRPEPYSVCPRTPGGTPDPVGDIPLPLATDYREAGASNGPATFWISNPNNTYIGNVAAGSRGAGFWYHLDTVPTAESSQLPGACSINPRNAPFGRFENNRVRASRQGFTSCIDGSGPVGMDTPGALIEGLAVMNVGQGLWPCGGNQTFHNAVVANTDNGMQAPMPFTFSDSLFIAYTDNAPPRAARSVDAPWAAIITYDQGFNFDNIHFVNYDRPAMSVFQIGGGAHKATSNRSSNLSFQNSPNVFRDIFDAWEPTGSLDPLVISTQSPAWGEVIHDLDGTLIGLSPTGNARAFASAHPLMVDSTCSRPPGSGLDGYGCEHGYASLFIDAQTPGLIGRAPWVTYQRSDGVHDTAEHGVITLRALHNFISDGTYRHSYRFLDGYAHNKYLITLMWAKANSSAIIELMDIPTKPVPISPVVAGAEPYVTTWTQLSNLGDLENSLIDAYYYRPETASLFLKIHTAGPDWFAMKTVTVCLNPSGSNCPPTSRSVAAPKVQITSPADKARVAITSTSPTPSATFTVTATLTDSAGLSSATLFSGKQIGGSQTFSGAPQNATASLGITLPSGSHPLTLIAKNVNGESFTAIQQVHVGDIDPRIQITSPLLVDNGTYIHTSIPNLTFAIYNWSANSKHAHWSVDGVDQGDVPNGNNIPLGNLSQGRHEIEVALADANHNVYPMREKRTIYMARAGLLADYEDGIDPRGSFVQHRVSGDVSYPVYSAWTPVRVSRDPGGIDDVNWLVLVDPNGARVGGTYTLALNPAMDWSGYNKLQVDYIGPGFELLIRYANANQLTSLGTTTVNGGSIATFNLPTPLAGPVAEIILRHPVPCSGCMDRQHLKSIGLLNSP